MSELHIMFFPFLAQGHMIPMLDMAKLFASRGVKTTIITTPLNAHVFERAKNINISLKIIKFPAIEAGLPEGIENVDQLTSTELIPSFFKAISMLQKPLEQVLHESRPNCLVAESVFPWSTDVAGKFNIPRLVFNGVSPFTLCACHSLEVYKPFKNVSSDSEPFVLPNLPHEIKMTKSQLSPLEKEDPSVAGFAKFLLDAREADVSSYGVILNCFYELQPVYADLATNVLNQRILNLGPLSLSNRDLEDKTERGNKSSIDQQECLKWLDSKKPNSVIYVGFGSFITFPTSQLYEIAMALEASCQDFIWVIREVKYDEDERCLPEGFEERVKGKGLIIKGWAPQTLILDHEAVGGFMTHAGWSSLMEGVCGGVPMATWPFHADQFFNEKLVTEVLRIGVAVGVDQWTLKLAQDIKSETIEKAVMSLMAGKDTEEMRKRAKDLKEAARRAVEEGGSSYDGLSALIEELTNYGS